MLKYGADDLLAHFLEIASASEHARAQTTTTIDRLDERRLTLRMTVGVDGLRPGGTVSGPTLVAIIDSAGWLVTVAHSGPGADAFTTDLSVQFLRPVAAGEILIEATALRIGRRCIIGVDVDTAAADGPGVRATVTFAPVFPPAPRHVS